MLRVYRGPKRAPTQKSEAAKTQNQETTGCGKKAHSSRTATYRGDPIKV